MLPLALRVEVDASPVYEMLLQVCTFASGHALSTYEVGQRWRGTQQGRCSPRMLRAFERLESLPIMWDQLVGVQAEVRAPTVAAFLDLVEGMDPEELQRQVTGFYSNSLTKDERALSERARSRAAKMTNLTELVMLVLRGWHERIFARDEAAIAAVLDEDARARRMLSTTDPARLILLTTGVRYVPMPGITRVVLIPALVMRPWLGVVSQRCIQIYCYPVLEDPGGIESTVPPFLIRLYGALATPGCLRILQTLGDEQLTVPEIAERVGDKQHLVRANLARLRVGRLVQITCNGAGDTVYERRSELMRAVGQPLKSFLHLPAVPFPAGRESSEPQGPVASEG